MVGRFRALLIGNGDFGEESGLTKLQGPKHDIDALLQILTDVEIGLHQKADIKILEDLSKIEVLSAIEQELKNSGSSDHVLIYYSGHGILDLHDQLYLCTKDSKRDAVTTAIWSSELNNLFRSTRARSVVVLLDCCYAGAFSTRGGGDIARCFQAEGLFVLGSAGSNELAPDTESGGVFTRLVVEALGSAVDVNQDGIISLEDIYAYLRPKLKGGATPTMTIVRGVEYPPLVKARAHALPPPNQQAAPQELTLRRKRAALATSDTAAIVRLPIPMSTIGYLASALCALGINSLFAVLGSFLSGHLYYWPAFLFSSLAMVYLGSWGVAVAVISPALTSFLFGDAPLWVYFPGNLVQSLLVLIAFRLGRFDPALRSWRDRVVYVLFGAFLPSVVGGASAWWFFTLTPTPVRESMFAWIMSWALENTIPVVVPGLWLFRVIGDSYKPFSWGRGKMPITWMRRSLDFTAPWIASLLCVGVMLIAIAMDMTGHQVGHTRWQDFAEHMQKNSVFRYTTLILLICILYSIGSGVQQAKQWWALMEAVRRHLPNRRISELLTSALTAPTEQRVVSVLITDMRQFNAQSAALSPVDSLGWLNNYFSRMCLVSEKHGGSVDRFMGDGLMVVFGLQSEDAQSIQAMMCALDMIDEIAVINEEQDAGYPTIRVGLGVSTGIVVAGEIGSTNRRQYTIIGNTVNLASQLESETRSLPGNLEPVLFSRETIRHSGLMAHQKREQVLVERPISVPGFLDKTTGYAPKASAIPKLRHYLEQILERSAEAKS